MKPWVQKALQLLEASLKPPRHELNELDWKSDLSPDKKRLTEHLSAMGNQSGGGFLVFGIKNTGDPEGVTEADIERIVNQLANLGRESVDPSLKIEHTVETVSGAPLLLVFIPESPVKPVHLRGKSLEKAFVRSGGTTRIASRQEIGNLMLQSRTPIWEELPASTLLTDAELIDRLDARAILEMLDRPIPGDSSGLLDWMGNEQFIIREPGGGGRVTNLGVMAAAKRLSDFPDLSRKAIRVVVYEGMNKSVTKHEQEGTKGYAISFQGLLDYVVSLLPQSEVIEKALRQRRTLYPEIALRELIANSLIHQDFTIRGSGPMIEIFSNRIEISNPGALLASKDVDRLIGAQPESRNEKLARAFRRYKICEERGSGLLKAGIEVELYGLPPIKFEAGANAFKVTLFAPRSYAEMSSQERLDACYQHAVLKYVSGSAMSNTTLRERLKMPEKQRSMVSTLIQQAVELGRINPANPESKSKKFAEYIPYWA
jgi:predicted HTH transcriptional regulator